MSMIDHSGPPARERLIRAALELFNERGFRATGIDTILQHAGIAKATLYHHFKTKDDLIVAALERKTAEWAAGLRRDVESRSSDARERLGVFFEVLEEWFASDSFEGCLFIRAAGEFGAVDDPIHVAAARAKQALEGLLLDLVRSAGLRDPEGMTQQLLLLVEGAIVTSQIRGDPSPARTAKQAAMVLIGASGGTARAVGGE